MIIHCLSCGKSVSTHMHKCPHCISEISEMTLELNGISEKIGVGERFRSLVLQFVHKKSA